MAVISNWMWEATELVHELELARHFEVLIISAQVGYQKPNAGIFRHALGRTGVDAERAVHVGDSYRADVVGARAAAITPVLIDRGHATSVSAGQARDDTDVAVIDDLYGLLDLLGLESPRDALSSDAGATAAAS
jgi:putative hydrolase of the HAD superfamily